jgi:hypothetical protein
MSEPLDETAGKLVGEADGEGDGAKLYVVDPDDYARTRRLKTLSDAKSQVRRSIKGEPTTGIGQQRHRKRVARAVAMYGHDLLPLLEAAEDEGVLDNPDYVTKFGHNVRSFIIHDGRIRNDEDRYERAIPADSMAVYRHLQRLERKLGLGLDLEREETNEWEIGI